MIPLQEAIDTNAWLRGEFVEKFQDGRLVTFQIRLRQFSKVDLTTVDCPEEISHGIGIDANVWILKCEIVNLSKSEILSGYITSKLCLVDEGNYEFMIMNDSHLTLSSEFAKTNDLKNFFAAYLPPKIKRSGAILFELPEFVEYLSMKVSGGSLAEL